MPGAVLRARLSGIAGTRGSRHAARVVALADSRSESVGEFDGRVKYGRLLRPGQEPGDAVFEEKRREDLIRDEQWDVVRWTWGEISRPARVAQRVGRALDRARRRVR